MRRNEPGVDVVVVGATPGGLAAAIAAARLGRRVTVLERTRHIGGLPANGLGITDILTREATGGIFREFVQRVKTHYLSSYGVGSQPVEDCDQGYRFEPSVAEQVYETMVREQPSVTVLRRRQFEAKPGNVQKLGPRLNQILVTNLDSGEPESYRAQAFVDATYEGDLAAAAGAPYRVGRESKADHG